MNKPLYGFRDRSRPPANHWLADLYCSRIDLWITCNDYPPECLRSVKVDLLATIAKHGNLRVDDVRRRFKCEVCGRRNPPLTLSSPGGCWQPPRPLPDGTPLAFPQEYD